MLVVHLSYSWVSDSTANHCVPIQYCNIGKHTIHIRAHHPVESGNLSMTSNILTTSPMPVSQTSPCFTWPSCSIESHRKSSKTSCFMPSRATHLASHVSWPLSCLSIDDCTPPSGAHQTCTSTPIFSCEFDTAALICTLGPGAAR